jgi:hypothetical protein
MRDVLRGSFRVAEQQPSTGSLMHERQSVGMPGSRPTHLLYAVRAMKEIGLSSCKPLTRQLENQAGGGDSGTQARSYDGFSAIELFEPAQ